MATKNRPEIDLSLFRYKTPVIIRWSDLDAFQHVNNAVYLTYFEQGRIQYFRDIPIEWDWRKAGAILAHAEVDYRLPLHFNDNAWIYIRCSRMGTRSVDFEYLITKINEDNSESIVNSGLTTLVTYDYTLEKSIPLPVKACEDILKFEGRDLRQA